MIFDPALLKEAKRSASAVWRKEAIRRGLKPARIGGYTHIATNYDTQMLWVALAKEAVFFHWEKHTASAARLVATAKQ